MITDKNLSEADHLQIYESACLIDTPPSWNEIAQAAYDLANKRAADRIATLEGENAELVEKVKRTQGSCNKLAKLLRDSERFIKDPSDKYAALDREHLLKAIDAALQPKAQEGK